MLKKLSAVSDEIQAFLDKCAQFHGNLDLSEGRKDFHMGIYVVGNINAENTELHVLGPVLVEGAIHCPHLHATGPVLCMGGIHSKKDKDPYADDPLMTEEE